MLCPTRWSQRLLFGLHNTLGKLYLTMHELTDAQIKQRMASLPPKSHYPIHPAMDGCGIIQIHTCDLSTAEWPLMGFFNKPWQKSNKKYIFISVKTCPAPPFSYCHMLVSTAIVLFRWLVESIKNTFDGSTFRPQSAILKTLSHGCPNMFLNLYCAAQFQSSIANQC